MSLYRGNLGPLGDIRVIAKQNLGFCEVKGRRCRTNAEVTFSEPSLKVRIGPERHPVQSQTRGSQRLGGRWGSIHLWRRCRTELLQLTSTRCSDKRDQLLTNASSGSSLNRPRRFSWPGADTLPVTALQPAGSYDPTPRRVSAHICSPVTCSRTKERTRLGKCVVVIGQRAQLFLQEG